MDIISIAHKGLREFIESNDNKGLNQSHVSRLRNILAALIAARDIDAVHGPPGWRIHRLKGEREGVWSISVTGNWRLTFIIVDGDITDLDLEDYH